MKKFDEFVNNQNLENRFDKISNKIDFDSVKEIEINKKAQRRFRLKFAMPILAAGIVTLAAIPIIIFENQTFQNYQNRVIEVVDINDGGNTKDKDALGFSNFWFNDVKYLLRPLESANEGEYIADLDKVYVEEGMFPEADTDPYKIYKFHGTSSYERIYIKNSTHVYYGEYELTSKGKLYNASFTVLSEFCGVFDPDDITFYDVSYVKNEEKETSKGSAIKGSSNVNEFIGNLKNITSTVDEFKKALDEYPQKDSRGRYAGEIIRIKIKRNWREEVLTLDYYKDLNYVVGINSAFDVTNLDFLNIFNV